MAWSSEDDAVATVGSAYGEVTGVSPGVVRITAARVVDASKTASVSVPVEEEPIDATNRVVIGAAQEPGLLGDVLHVAGSSAIAIEVNAWLFAGLDRVVLHGTLEPDLVTEVATRASGRKVIAADGDGQRVTSTRTCSATTRVRGGRSCTRSIVMG